MPGKYKSLYQYLDNQYGNAVDLTFAQIEDHSASRCLTRLASITSGGRTKTRTTHHSLIRDRGHWPAGQPRRICRPRPLFLNERPNDSCGDFLTRPSLIHPFTP